MALMDIPLVWYMSTTAARCPALKVFVTFLFSVICFLPNCLDFLVDETVRDVKLFCYVRYGLTLLPQGNSLRRHIIPVTRGFRDGEAPLFLFPIVEVMEFLRVVNPKQS